MDLKQNSLSPIPSRDPATAAATIALRATTCCTLPFFAFFRKHQLQVQLRVLPVTRAPDALHIFLVLITLQPVSPPHLLKTPTQRQLNLRASVPQYISPLAERRRRPWRRHKSIFVKRTSMKFQNVHKQKSNMYHRGQGDRRGRVSDMRRTTK
ncbi:hypothetical protein BC827DRAFT_1201709 [Russula dissimulans]|nr:hypothetical protein BC827DRAFT_1201709 [Russula dissimulans]